MTRSALLCLILFFLVAAPPTSAEDAPGSVRVELQKKHAVPLGTTIRLEMKNATVGEVFAAIQAASEGGVQFVVSQSTKDLPLPALKLQDTPIVAAANLFGQLVPDLHINVSLGSEMRSVRGLLDEAGTDGLEEYLPPGSGTNVVVVDLAKYDEDENLIKRELRIVPLGKLVELKTVGIEDIATAIETVWSMEPIGHVASLKYHEETSLLICYGTQRHLQLMDEVIEGIQGHGLEQAHLRRIGNLEGQLQGLMEQIAQLRYQLDRRSTLTAQLRAKIQKLEVDVAAAGIRKKAK